MLPELVAEIAKSTDALGLCNQFELVLVNDGSPDDSWQVIAKLAEEYEFLVGVSLRKNFGQHSAIMAGLHYAHGEIVIVMDDDLQHPPEEIGKLLDAIDAGFDVAMCAIRDASMRFGRSLVAGSMILARPGCLGKPKGLVPFVL